MSCPGDLGKEASVNLEEFPRQSKQRAAAHRPSEGLPIISYQRPYPIGRSPKEADAIDCNEAAKKFGGLLIKEVGRKNMNRLPKEADAIDCNEAAKKFGGLLIKEVAKEADAIDSNEAARKFGGLLIKEVGQEEDE